MAAPVQCSSEELLVSGNRSHYNCPIHQETPLRHDQSSSDSLIVGERNTNSTAARLTSDGDMNEWNHSPTESPGLMSTDCHGLSVNGDSIDSEEIDGRREVKL